VGAIAGRGVSVGVIDGVTVTEGVSVNVAVLVRVGARLGTAVREGVLTAGEACGVTVPQAPRKRMIKINKNRLFIVRLFVVPARESQPLTANH
jgi:hypothetical protein